MDATEEAFNELVGGAAESLQVLIPGNTV